MHCGFASLEMNTEPEMNARENSSANGYAVIEVEGRDCSEISPPFQLARQFAPPRTAVMEVARMKPHPAILKYGVLPTAVQLEPLRAYTDKHFECPLFVTENGILIDGKRSRSDKGLFRVNFNFYRYAIRFFWLFSS